MALIQEVKDGKFVEDTKKDTTSNGARKKNVSNEMGKDQFLQLLVAQMQYQDPLEPTSNTEWVAQMATFSMVESLNNMSEAFSHQSANNLVGKYVLIDDGKGGYVKGKVDYITKQDGTTKLSVDDKLYDIDQLDTIADEEYYQGSVMANEFEQMVKLLPDEKNLSIKEDGLVRSAREHYDKMTESQQKFVKKETLDKLTTLENKMDALKATHLTGLVRGLPTESQIMDADKEKRMAYSDQYVEAQEYYDLLTEKQKKLVAEETVSRLKQVADAINAASMKDIQAPSGDDAQGPGTSAADTSVADLLAKILAELQGKNKAEENTGEETPGQQTDGAGTEAAGEP